MCCDAVYAVFAEPPGFFQRPDVDLFGHLPTSGEPTTFYDPVCGIPLFKAPLNRTLAEFKSDSIEHSWPSFRGEEAITDNLVVSPSGTVKSKCGTKLGDYTTDENDGTGRYCIDLSCIAGNPKP